MLNIITQAALLCSVDGEYNCIHAMIALINKHPTVKLNVATSQSYSSFVHSVKHEILGGYVVRCSIDGCYVCSSG